MAARTKGGFLIRLPTWFLSILAVAALSGAGMALTTLANANQDHSDTIPNQQRQINDLTAAVGQIKTDVASLKADSKATRAFSEDSNTKINLLLTAAIAKTK